MSFKPDNIEHELTTEELLYLIFQELKMMRLHLEIVTDEKISAEDVKSEN